MTSEEIDGQSLKTERLIMTAQNRSSLESRVQVGPQTGGHKYAFMQLQYIESRRCELAANWFKL